MHAFSSRLVLAVIVLSALGRASAQSPDRPKPRGYNPLVGVPGYSNEPAQARGAVYASAQVVDPQPRTDKKPVVIRVEGNRLVLESDDIAALDAVAGMLQAYSDSGSRPTENLFKVIRLKNVLAEDAARTISEVFNGPQQQRSGNPGGGGNQGGGRGGRGPGGGGLDIGALLMGLGSPAESATTVATGANPNRVRVVAERSSNSLVVVKASPIDLLTIESLLDLYIDAGVSEDAVAMKSWIVQVHNADAADMANTIRELYRSVIQPSSGSSGAQIGQAFGAQPQGGNQKSALSLSVDDRSNSLVLHCSEAMKSNIESLVQSLDRATVRTTEVVRLIPLNGLDPNILQQAVDAIQGVDASARQQRGGMGGNGVQGMNGGMGGNSLPGSGEIGGRSMPGGLGGANGLPAGGGANGRGGAGAGGRGGR